MNEKQAHITVKNLTMAYGSFVLMRNLNFTVNRKDIFIIMGGSALSKRRVVEFDDAGRERGSPAGAVHGFELR